MKFLVRHYTSNLMFETDLNFQYGNGYRLLQFEITSEGDVVAVYEAV